MITFLLTFVLLLSILLLCSTSQKVPIKKKKNQLKLKMKYYASLSNWKPFQHKNYSHYNNVFGHVWIEHKLLTVDHFEAITFAGVAVDLHGLDVQGQAASVLHFKGSSQTEVGLFQLYF